MAYIIRKSEKYLGGHRRRIVSICTDNYTSVDGGDASRFISGCEEALNYQDNEEQVRADTEALPTIGHQVNKRGGVGAVVLAAAVLALIIGGLFLLGSSERITAPNERGSLHSPPTAETKGSGPTSPSPALPGTLDTKR